jgi:phenylpropionate dioxygenase-like ring-hydroxylating dioxygenase large terminal subunit
MVSSMFKKLPKILAHNSVLSRGNFVTNEFILNQNNELTVNLFRRFCPHRMYPLASSGTSVEDITCKFHGLHWDKNGNPTNSTKRLNCGEAFVGKSGLVFKDFIEPDHQWVQDLNKEQRLNYSHSFHGSSNGSWLWFMDVNTDLLHVFKDGIHPTLSKQVNLEDIKMDQGDGWILQTHPDGWWCCIYPFTFVEYGRPGMLSINIVTPNNINTEYGFTWMTQIYYDDTVGVNNRIIFETLETVFREDIQAAELQKGNYFPLINAMNRYEDHCVHFGNWVKDNRLK